MASYWLAIDKAIKQEPLHWWGELCGDWAEQPLHIASNSFFVESTLTFPKRWDLMKFTRSGWPAEKSTKLRRYIPEEASVKSTQQESTFSESKDYIDIALYAKVGVFGLFQLRRSGCTHSTNNVVGCSGFESTTRVRSRRRPMMIKRARPITRKLFPHMLERLGLGGASSRVTTSWGWRVQHYDGPTNAIVQASTAPSGYSSCLSRTRKNLDKNFTYHAKHLVTATKEYISTVDAEEHILKNSC